jgi:hypothetical protein
VRSYVSIPRFVVLDSVQCLKKKKETKLELNFVNMDLKIIFLSIYVYKNVTASLSTSGPKS